MLYRSRSASWPACQFLLKKSTPRGEFGSNQKTDKATGAKRKKLAPGMIMELDAGDEIQVVNPSGQASNTKDMATILLRAFSSALGLSYEATSRDRARSTTLPLAKT